MKNAKLSSIKQFLVGGSTVPSDLPKQMKKYLPNGQIQPVYGMSELGGTITTITKQYSRNGSVGQVWKRLIIKIVDANGKRCGTNEKGEICIKPYFKFIGYYGNDEATKELYDDEGFIRSADIGYFDDDGFLFFVEREKDFLRYFGYRISPSEIENFLIKSPDIKFVCIVGIPDEFDYDLVAAMVIRNNGANLSEKDVSNMVSSNLCRTQ